MNYKYSRHLFFTLFSFFGLTYWSHAQPPTGSPPASPPAGVVGEPCWDQECIPIDSGVIFLIIAGLLLAIRMIYSFKSKSKSK